jgi:hypothetical protein
MSTLSRLTQRFGLASGSSHSGNPHGRLSPGRSRRLGLEVLEDRLSPATLTVNSTADTANPSDPYLSLREAIPLVNSPTLPIGLSDQILAQIVGTLHEGGSDTIVFDHIQVTGPIVLSGTQLELSLPGSTASVSIDGGGEGINLDGANLSRVLQVDSGVQAILDRLTITHGSVTGENFGGGISNSGTLTVSSSTLSSNSAPNGGGIYNDHGTLTVSHSTFSSNSGSQEGGGISNYLGTVTVSNSTLSANSASSYGGGIASHYGGAVTVSDSTLSSNSASIGGGIWNYVGRVTVTSSILSANFTSSGVGGGIDNHGTLTLTSSTLSANSAYNGGGISNNGGTLTVTGSTLSANSADGVGGGIYNLNYGGTVTVSHSTLSANSATDSGGGIYNYSGTLTVSHSTLSANSALIGGGIYNYSGTLTVSHSTLSANSARADGGVSNNRGTLRLQNTLVAGNRASSSNPDINGVVDSGSGYNLVGDGTGLSGISDGVNGNQIGTAASPIDPRLSPLGYYGGPTQTFALLPGSPALDAGDPADTGTDQRGQSHLSGPSDVGAFQTQPDPFVVTTLADPGRLSGSMSLREAVALANVLPGDKTISFAETLDGGAVVLAAGELELSGSGGVTTIEGAGRFTLDGGNATRLVQVDPGTTAVLRGLALVNGNAGVGAGVYNRGSLTVADCVLYGNTAYAGGAFLNQGLLTLSGCTVGFNVATFGAAVLNSGVLVAFNSTFAYNAALAAGGAIRNDPTGTAVLTSLTVSRNSADEGGGLDVAGGLVTARNCIVAGNYTADGVAASDISGEVDASSRYNLVGTGGSGGLTDGVNHNLVGVADPGLTTPDFSIGQTPVFGLTDDSPALGTGDPTLLSDPLLRQDQHGNVRTDPVNIGAT